MVGCGHISAARAPAVKKNMKIIEAEAEPPTDNQFSFPLTSITGTLDKSTLLKKLNKGDVSRPSQTGALDPCRHKRVRLLSIALPLRSNYRQGQVRFKPRCWRDDQGSRDR